MDYEQTLINNRTKLIDYFTFNLDQHIAKDLYQDLFIKVKLTLATGKYFEQGKFMKWVMYVAKNLMIDHIRKIRRSKEIPMRYHYDNRGRESSALSYKSDQTLNAEDQIIYDDLCNEIITLYERLAEDQKEVMGMRIFRRMSYKDIVEETGRGQNTVLGQMRYAIINIKKRIK